MRAFPIFHDALSIWCGVRLIRPFLMQDIKKEKWKKPVFLLISVNCSSKKKWRKDTVPATSRKVAIWEVLVSYSLIWCKVHRMTRDCKAHLQAGAVSLLQLLGTFLKKYFYEASWENMQHVLGWIGPISSWGFIHKFFHFG